MHGRHSPGETALLRLAPAIAKAAQAVYDAWEQDEDGEDPDYGAGGICDDIAEAIVEVIGSAVLECRTFHISDDNHTLVFAKMPDGVYSVDIPPGVYETGGWYVYKKREDVEISADDVVIDRVESDPEKWSMFEAE